MICAFSEKTRVSEYSGMSLLRTALKRLWLLDDFISIPLVCLGRLLWFGHDVLTEAGTHLSPRKFSAPTQGEDEGRAGKREGEKKLTYKEEKHYWRCVQRIIQYWMKIRANSYVSPDVLYEECHQWVQALSWEDEFAWTTTYKLSFSSWTCTEY